MRRIRKTEGRTPPPAAAEINVHDSLDERWALEVFLGKSLSEAEAIFRENDLANLGHLLWMGPKAFCYYVTAAIRYLESDSSAGSADGVNSFLFTLEHRLEFDRDGIAPAFPALRDAVRYILDHWEKFDVPGSPEDWGEYTAPSQLYADLPARYAAVLQVLNS